MSRTGNDTAAQSAAASSATLRNRLKLRQLALLAELEAAGTLHKAAERLGMSQPAATRLVHELEALMGSSLFERSSRGMAPTDMGRLLMRHASVVLAGIDHVYHEAAALRSGSAGILRIGMNAGAPPVPVAEATLQLKRETPRMEVTLVQGNNDALLEDLRDGRLDVVVGRAPASGGKEAFDFELLYSEHFAIVCGAQNPHTALQTAPCAFEDLIDLPWILPDGNTALRSNLELLFLSRCGRMPDDCIQAVGSPVLGLLVTQGHRIAAVPGWLAREQQRMGQMRILLARLPNITGPIGITRRAGEGESSQGLRFAEALRRACDAFLAAPADPENGSPLPNS